MSTLDSLRTAYSRAPDAELMALADPKRARTAPLSAEAWLALTEEMERRGLSMPDDTLARLGDPEAESQTPEPRGDGVLDSQSASRVSATFDFDPRDHYRALRLVTRMTSVHYFHWAMGAGPQVRAVDAGGYHSRGNGVQLDVPWHAMQRLVETQEQFLFLYNKRCAYYIPKRFFRPEQIRDVRTLATGKLGERARVLRD